MLGKIKINQITLNGIELRNELYRFYLEGLFDHDKTSFDSELYNDGQFNNSSKINPRSIVLNGYIKSNNFKDHMVINHLLANKNEQKLIVDVEGFGKLETHVIVSTLATDENGIKSCQLIATDPYLYGETKVLNIRDNKGTGIRLPVAFPIQFYKNNELVESIENEGSVVSYPVIKIKGPCRNFIIKNITTNERLQFDIELLTGDELIIDNRPRTRGILLNGVNRIDLKNGNWISCIPGYNEFSFDRISLSTDSLCSVELQSRWL